MSRRTGLFLKYAASLVGLVTLVLLVNGALDVFFSFRDTRQALVRVQEEKAAAAAQRIEQFVTEIEQHIGWTTHAQWAAGSAEQRRFDYIRLTRQAQAITEIVHIDGEGKEQLKVSRLGMDMVGSGEDWSKDPRFIEARARRTEREAAKRVWFSPVYFRKGSEPYLSLAVAGTGRNAGVTVAEINLKLIWDPITAIKVGKQGYAYVVDAEGRLIAHPDISQVLRNTDLSGLPQVEAARAREPASPIARANDGREVLVAYAPIQRLGWFVFVELPLAEALQPLWKTLWQTGGLLVFGLVLALGLGLLLARRMSVPIRAVATGAERLGAGELGHRIDVRTGDEIEGLAQQFNRMAERLQESYAGLERKVEERTHELSEALQQQTATTEVLQTINASPGDLRPVFDAMLERAMRLCGAAFGFLMTYDGARFRPAAHRGVPQALADYFLSGPDTPRLGDAHARILAGEDVVHNPDQMSEEAYRSGNPLRRAVVDLGGARSALVVALRKEREVLGTLTIYRKEVRPFSAKEIELVQNFAAQAVIAMENARLLGELQARQTELARSVEELTATANVLGVISSSPGELAPVFDAVLENATRICEAEFGILWVYKDGVLDLAASHHAPDEFIETLQARHVRPGRDTLVGRTLLEGTIVHIRDVLEDQEYGWRDAQRSGSLRTMLGVPLLREGVPIGVLGLHRTSVRAFTEKQIALVRTFADQAVIAIENARLLGELQARQAELARSVEELTATSDVLKVISRSAFDLEPTLQTLIETAARLCRAEKGSIFRFEDEAFRWLAGYGHTREFVEDRSRMHFHPGSGSLVGRTALARRPVQIVDVLADPEYELKDGARLGGIRSVLGVPLLREGTMVGVVNLARAQVEPFTEKEIELVSTFADQAVIAIENARLVGEFKARQAELARSVEELEATAEVLRIVASSPEDLEPVFATMLSNAVRLCEAQFGTLWTYEDGLFHCVAELGATPAFKDWLAEGPKKAGPATALGRIERERHLVHFEDITADETYRAGDPMRRAAADLLGARTVLAIPMLRESRLVGALMIHRDEVRPFAEKQIELVETFADQAVIAIANVRLVRELRARTGELARSVEELNTLREVGQQVSASLDLKTVLKTIVERAVALSGADGGMLWRYDKGGRTFHLRTAHGFGDELVEALRALALPEDQTVMGDATRERRPIELSDLAEMPRMPLRDTMAAAGFRSSLVVPLVGARRTFGALVIQRRSPGAFPPATVNLMQALASQSVLAIQNARLFREIEEKGRQLAIASQHKSQFLANMSHELRTPLNAVLGYAELLVDGLYGELPERARGVLERIQANGRHLLGLINDVLDLSKIEAGQLVLAHEDYTVTGLVQSVTSATEGLARAKGLALETDVPAGLPTGRGDERRLTQVLLNLVGNAIKFTEAGRVGIAARAAGGFFEIAVSDTGPGIAEADQARIFEEFQQVDNSSTRKKGGTGLGLAISRRIVAMHGGTLTVQSHPGEGATFRIRIPVRSEEKKEAAE